jgi:hypothetical protein
MHDMRIERRANGENRFSHMSNTPPYFCRVDALSQYSTGYAHHTIHILWSSLVKGLNGASPLVRRDEIVILTTATTAKRPTIPMEKS